MTKLYLSELSRKAQKRVNKSLRLFNKFSNLERDYSFEQTEAGSIDFFARDPVTVITAAGEIFYNNLGFITESSGLGKHDKGTPDFYHSVEYFGKNGFKKHTKAGYKRGDELTEIIAKHGFSKQLSLTGLMSFLEPMLMPPIQLLLILVRPITLHLLD